MKLTQVKDTPIYGTISPAFAEITIGIMTHEESGVEITFDFETFETMVMKVPENSRPTQFIHPDSYPNELEDQEDEDRRKNFYGTLFTFLLMVAVFGLGWFVRGLF